MEIKIVHLEDVKKIVKELIDDKDKIWLTDQECAQRLGMEVSTFKTHHKCKIPRTKIGNKNITLKALQRYQEENLICV